METEALPVKQALKSRKSNDLSGVLMYAVVVTGGKQYRVEEGQTFKVKN